MSLQYLMQDYINQHAPVCHSNLCLLMSYAVLQVLWNGTVEQIHIWTHCLKDSVHMHSCVICNKACLTAGSWVLVEGPELKWTEGDRWHAMVNLPGGSVYEYKYVLLDNSGTNALTWQRGNNSVLAIKQVRSFLHD